MVTGARDAAHARRLLEGLEFDLIVLDVMMPGEDGLALTASLRETMTTPILLLTARGDADDRILGLEAGADDYLPKPFEPRELLLRINAILRRVPKPRPESRAAEDAASRRGALRPRPRRALARARPDPPHRHRIDADAHLRRPRPHEPVTRQELVEDLGGGIAEAQERAVDVQITRLRRKIEEDPQAPRYLQTVRGSGYMLAPD